MIEHLDLLADSELVRLISFHAGCYQNWQRTHLDTRVSVIYHGQILLALLEECDRRGKTPLEMGADINRSIDMAVAWQQKPGSA